MALSDFDSVVQRALIEDVLHILERIPILEESFSFILRLLIPITSMLLNNNVIFNLKTYKDDYVVVVYDYLSLIRSLEFSYIVQRAL